MKIVGLTGGIGSGKSTIAMLFKALGVPVYIADIEAKKILASSKVVRAKVISLLGTPAYSNEVPNRDYIAQLVFNDPDLLAGLNAIIHPEVHTSFKLWATLQDAHYCIKEAAILQARMENQWEDQKKIPLANYVIENIDLTNTKNQVQKIHKTLLSTCISSL